MNRRQLLSKLPALGAVLCGVAAQPKRSTKSQAYRVTPYGAVTRGDDGSLVQPARWEPVSEAEARDVADSLAQEARGEPFMTWQDYETQRFGKNDTIPGQPYHGPDNGPRLSPASAVDLEPANGVGAPVTRSTTVSLRDGDILVVSMGKDATTQDFDTVTQSTLALTRHVSSERAGVLILPYGYDVEAVPRETLAAVLAQAGREA